MPKAWSAGTSGAVSGEVVFAPVFGEKQIGEIWDLQTLADGLKDYAAAQKGKLRGKIVLIEPPSKLTPPGQPDSERYDAAKLDVLAEGPEPLPQAPLDWPLQRLPSDPDEREIGFDHVR